MITLPNTPFPILQISRAVNPSQPQYIREILTKRLSVNTTNSSTSLFISNLEEYLNLIYTVIVQTEGIGYEEVLKFSESIEFNESIPWILPFSTGNKFKSIVWRLSDEITTVLVNLIFAYNLRSSEIILKALSNYQGSLLDEKESQQLWISCFKFYKKSLEYLNFLKSCNNTSNDLIFETSANFTNFLENLISISIQLTFLSKSIWSLKLTEYDVSLKSNTNYSTLSRVAIFVRDQTKLMINGLRSQNIDSDSWLGFLENLVKLNNAYIGTFLSIENYKLDHIGKSIGFLNIAIENITKKSASDDDLNDEFDNDSKLKKKFSTFKQKLNKSNSNDKVKKVKNNLKINSKIYENLQNQTLQKSITYLFELVKILNLKYNLENNNLKFDIVMNSSELYQNHLPTGRSVPITDRSVSWIPDVFTRSSTDQQNSQTQGQYY
jgi:hypothetical protein